MIIRKGCHTEVPEVWSGTAFTRMFRKPQHDIHYFFRMRFSVNKFMAFLL